MARVLILFSFCLLSLICTAGCADTNRETPAASEHITTISFVCVGDNLIHEQIWRCHKKGEDGRYNFADLYAPVKEIVLAADIALVNQETVCGGEALTLADWPRFNSPQEILDALIITGFNWISTANNHALDRGEKGVLAQIDYIAKKPGVTWTGTHTSWEERARPRIIVKNGVRIGMASYTYGTNGIAPPLGQEYLVDIIDETRIREDMLALTKESDIQVIAMHWGEEYSVEPTKEQQKLAQLLADAGADVIIGAHSHVVQTPVFLQGANGNTTLVYYSLGNFMSSQTEPEQMLGAMARFDIEYDTVLQNSHIISAEILPLITHISADYQTYTVYPFEDYTAELARDHALAPQGFSLNYLSERIKEVFGDNKLLGI